ncbi:HpcH/HpaI aldolase/citrate lyase family protein [Palleronia pelagia]|uniref:Citrate lyase subunit beta / citryl-CoA lyase n=1 Tax=Palleronia pelagia TaxID=387096 RepID=A0A1H8JIQ6_9RHOB|nr:CoA ester lyase [Palleronia pelagia]SEN80186.1 citrate lyase subunit beta / citryl-CoA lyase [Palleronia pelagia]
MTDTCPRSWLFAPGDSARKMEKALGSGADAVIFDLEDSVAPDAKDAARARTAEALAAPVTGAGRWVRVNALDTGRTDADVAATVGGGPDGYVLPKCEGAEDIASLAAMIDGHGGGTDLPIVVIATETARAVRNLAHADWSHPSLYAMAWGAEDLAADLGALANRDEGGAFLRPFLLARDTMLFAARAAGVAAIDTVFTDFRDDAGLRAEAAAAMTLGFAGKLAIHPAQVAAIHEAYTPTAAQVDWAERVVAALDGKAGVAQLDGRMIDQPHLRAARRILALRDAARA